MSSPDAPPPSGPPGGFGVDLPPGVMHPEARGAARVDGLAASALVVALTTGLGVCWYPVAICIASTAILLAVLSMRRTSGQAGHGATWGLSVAAIVVAVVFGVSAVTLYFWRVPAP